MGTEDTLLIALENLYSIFDTLNDIFLIIRDDLSVIYCNPIAQTKIPWVMEDGINQGFASLLYKSDSDVLLGTITRLNSSSGKGLSCCLHMSEPDHSSKVYQCIVNRLVLNPDFRKNIFVMQLIPVHSELSTPECLTCIHRFSEEHHRGVAILDTQGKIIENNTHFLKMLRIHHEIKGESLDQFCDPVFSETLNNTIDMIRNRLKEDVELEFECIMNGLERHWFRITFHHTQNVLCNRQSCILTLWEDISDFKKLMIGLGNSGAENFLLGKIFNINPNPTVISTFDRGEILAVNDIFCQETGYSEHELIGKTVHELSLLVDYQERDSYIEILKSQSSVRGYPCDCLMKSGSIRKVLMNIECYEFEGKKYLITVISDITEKIRLEKELCESENWYRNTFERAALGIAHLSKEGQFIRVNHQFCQITGCKTNELLAKRLNDILFHLDRQEDLDQFSQLTNRKINRYTKETRFQHKNGGSVWVSLTFSRITTPYNSVDHIVLFAQDISNRKDIEEDLFKNNIKLRCVIENACEAIVLIQDERIRDFNPCFNSIVGYNRTVLLGKPITEIIHRDDIDNYRRFITRNHLQQSFVNAIPIRVITENQEVRWCVVNDAYLQWEGMPAHVSFFQDITEKRVIEKDLATTQALLKTAVEQCQAGVVILEASLSKPPIVNYAALQILYGDMSDDCHHMELSYPINWKIFDAKMNEEIDLRDSPMGQAIKTGKVSKNEEYVIRQHNGKYRWISCNASPVYDGTGKIIAGISIILDITERKNSENLMQRFLNHQMTINELASSLGKLSCLNEICSKVYRLIQSHFKLICFIRYSCSIISKSIKPDFIILDDKQVNCDVMESLPLDESGYDPLSWVFLSSYPLHHIASEELVGFSKFDYVRFFIPEHLIPEWNNQDQSILFIPMSRDEDNLSVIQIVSLQNIPYSTEDIELLWAIGNFASIAIQKTQLIDEIQKHAVQVQTIIDTIPEGLALLDKDNKIVLLNPAAKDMLPNLTKITESASINYIGNRTLSQLSQSLPDGLWHEIDQSDNKYQVLIKESQYQEKVITIRDVTQQKQIEEKIYRQDQLAELGQLAAGIVHDFNNTMATIILSAEVSDEDELLGYPARDRLTNIKEQAHYASSLIRQILDFSRKSNLEYQIFNLVLFVTEIIGLAKRTFPENIGITLETELPEFYINADPTRFQQVMMNLLLNARDAMPDGGFIRIILSRLQVMKDTPTPIPTLGIGNWISIQIHDTGRGIPSHILPHIFKPFFTTKSSKYGTGLGLAQVDKLITQHGGFIEVSSDVGSGTCFTLYLPDQTHSSTPPPRKCSEMSFVSGNGELILVVEDMESMRSALILGLDQLNYNVIQANNGSEALMMLNDLGIVPDLVISDVIMPEMGGIELVQEMRKKQILTPVMLITGHEMREEMCLINSLNVFWQTKPINLDMLSQIISHMIKKQRSDHVYDSETMR